MSKTTWALTAVGSFCCGTVLGFCGGVSYATARFESRLEEMEKRLDGGLPDLPQSYGPAPINVAQDDNENDNQNSVPRSEAPVPATFRRGVSRSGLRAQWQAEPYKI